MIDVGFQVHERWLPIMDICFNITTANTLWVYHYLGPENHMHQRNVPRPSFIQSRFFPKLRIDRLYARNEQRQTIAKILQSEELANKLISNEPMSPFFLARGHLAAKADYVFGSQQMATFYYVNAAPQWQTFNMGNWLMIENNIKPFINKRNISADLYTGTYGIVQYQDKFGKKQDIYLSYNENGTQSKLPVPKLFFKIMLAKELLEGVVFIGVNNPYATQNEILNDNYIICSDVSDKINYISWDKHNITSGYTYACNVNDFVKNVPTAPVIPNVEQYKLLV